MPRKKILAAYSYTLPILFFSLVNGPGGRSARAKTKRGPARFLHRQDRTKKNIIMSVQNKSQGFFFLDYFSYSTNICTDWMFSACAFPKREMQSRFYKTCLFSDIATVQFSPRMPQLKEFNVRLTKEHLEDIFLYQLPEDCQVARVDFAIDVPTKKEAFKFRINKERTMQIKSKQGETNYFGDRKQPIFERVYQMHSRGNHWRYELEFKPRAGRKHVKFIKHANGQILDLWYEICSNMTLQGYSRKAEEKPMPFKFLTQVEKNWIDIHFQSDFVPVNYLFYVSLSDVGRAYMKHISASDKSEKAQSWHRSIMDYEKYLDFSRAMYPGPQDQIVSKYGDQL